MPVLPSIGTNLGSGWGALLKRTPYAGSTFGEVLADQVRFRTTRAGATSLEHVVPDSARSRELWELESTKRFVQGVLDLSNEVTGAERAQLRGFSLATSEAGYVANRATHHFGAGVEPTRRAYRAGVEAAREHVEGTAAVRKGAWLHLDPQRSAGMIHMLEHPGTPLSELSSRQRESLGKGVKTLLHELNHVGSPKPAGTDELSWLSEGGAETLARWPTRVKRAGDTLGFPVPARVGSWFDDAGAPYQEEVDSVRALLRMSGIDPSRARNYPAAERLLNGIPEDRLPQAFATAVAERHGADAAHARELRRTVRRLVERQVAPDGEHADPRAVQRLARELEAARRDRLT